jgi:hypothetical protein
MNNFFSLIVLLFTGNNNINYQNKFTTLEFYPANLKSTEKGFYSSLKKDLLGNIVLLQEINTLDCKKNMLHNLINLFKNKQWLSLENYFIEDEFSNVINEYRVQFLLAKFDNAKYKFLLIIHSEITIKSDPEYIFISNCGSLWGFLFRKKFKINFK